MAANVTNAIVKRIGANHRGWVFTPLQFQGLGSRVAIDKALSRLQKSGYIRRLASGIYEFPRIHPTIGILAPEPEAVAKAMAERTRSRIMMSEAKAANVLGLSSQVPMQNVFLTEGPSRTVKIGNQTISIKHVAPSKIAPAGTEAEIVIQAVRSFGRKAANEIPVAQLANKLSRSVKTSIKRRSKSAPEWSQPILRKIAQ